MNRNFCCLYVILPEWEYADMKAAIFIRINLRQIKNKSKEQETWISISGNRNYVFRGVNGMRSYDEYRKNFTPVKKGGCRVNAFAMPGMYYEKVYSK